MKLKGKELTKLNCILDRYIATNNKKELLNDLKCFDMVVRFKLLRFITEV